MASGYFLCIYEATVDIGHCSVAVVLGFYIIKAWQKKNTPNKPCLLSYRSRMSHFTVTWKKLNNKEQILNRDFILSFRFETHFHLLSILRNVSKTPAAHQILLNIDSVGTSLGSNCLYSYTMSSWRQWTMILTFEPNRLEGLTTDCSNLDL